MPGVGRVTDTHPGEDGIVRTVTIKTEEESIKAIGEIFMFTFN